jgi:hypothetical protein
MELVSQSATFTDRRLDFPVLGQDLRARPIRSSALFPSLDDKAVVAPLRPRASLSWEGVAWLALALGSLIALVVSFSV